MCVFSAKAAGDATDKALAAAFREENLSLEKRLGYKVNE